MKDLVSLCQKLIQLLPPNIRTGEELIGMDSTDLEVCSQLDPVICLALHQLATMTEEMPWEEMVGRKKKFRDKPNYIKYGLPMVCIE